MVPTLHQTVAREVVDTEETPLVVEGVQRHFGSFQVLKNIDFEVGAHELVSLVGQNGAGKTTLIAVFLTVPTIGRTIRVFGEDSGNWSPDHCRSWHWA